MTSGNIDESDKAKEMVKKKIEKLESGIPDGNSGPQLKRRKPLQRKPQQTTTVPIVEEKPELEEGADATGEEQENEQEEDSFKTDSEADSQGNISFDSSNDNTLSMNESGSQDDPELKLEVKTSLMKLAQRNDALQKAYDSSNIQQKKKRKKKKEKPKPKPPRVLKLVGKLLTYAEPIQLKK